MLIVVAAALTRPDGKVFVQQRPLGGSFGGLWEFPGGKLEPGETAEAALTRELSEELGIVVEPSVLVPISFATEPTASGQLLLLLYRCLDWRGEIKLLHATAADWLHPIDLKTLPMPSADRPLVDKLVTLASSDLSAHTSGRGAGD